MILKVLKRLGYINCVLMFCYFTNLFTYGYICGFLLVLSLLFKSKFLKHNIDFELLILFLFCFTYGLFYAFNPISGKQYIIIYIFTAPALYMWGKYLVHICRNPQQIWYLLITVGILLSLPGLLSVLLNIIDGGFVQRERNIPMFWGGNQVSATLMAAPMLFNMCLPSILLGKFNSSRLKLRICLLSFFGLTLMCILRLGSRTQIAVFIFTFVFTFLYLIPKQSLQRNIISFILLAVGLIFVIRNISFDYDSDWLNSFAGRMEKGEGDLATGGGRTDRWLKSFQNLFSKPLGWDIREFGYSHNLWLDVLRVSGIIPFTLLIVFTVKMYFKVRKLATYRFNFNPLNITIITYSVASFMVFMVEPTMDSLYYLFSSFCMIIGIFHALYEGHLVLKR